MINWAKLEIIFDDGIYTYWDDGKTLILVIEEDNTVAVFTGRDRISVIREPFFY